MVKTAMIGFGGIAQSHKNAHLQFEAEGREKLVAVCDIDPEQVKRRIKINLEDAPEVCGGHFNVYTDYEEMLRSEDVDLVDICVPSFLHAKIATEMLERGYNVLSEKPMALNSADCEMMLAAYEKAKKNGKYLMIGQCLHFYPEYEYLKACIDDGRFGKVTSAVFQRLSGIPMWSWQNWYWDYEKAGGVITDMQIHDLDMARWLFGEPEWVECRASSKYTKFDNSHVTLGYDFPVTCLGDWTLRGVKFNMSFRFGFEKASVILDGGKLTVYPADGSAAYEPDYRHPHTGIAGEVGYLLDLIENGGENVKNTPVSAYNTIRLVEAIRESAENGGRRVVPTFVDEN